jgi:anti-sigma factor (TIGR02949 family)
VSDELTCRQAFDRLEEYLDRELSAEETARVRAHLRICVQCTREFRFERLVLEALRDKVNRIRAPDGFQDRIVAALESAE